ncbi:hypothetical protein [Hoeflea ulvae]|uniref:HEAT repeat domain-containing protein n=1 Tax=Hoeflea ulvae TaxID=2983764 RepID=A0ABT3YBK0_9HYPH|nr:hypothetical protein [Hoeflea ulvae]MCY0093247.1 hypothetical protein [Hoeflea ulvae]
MKRNTKLWLAGSLLTLTLCPPAVADVTERYGELQSVIDAINDPDPLMRLAQLEEILENGNATDIQLAIRTAFSVDDPNVRSLALRAHFAGFRTFVVTAELPESVKEVLDGSDKDAAKKILNGYLFEFFENVGYQFSFQAEYPSNAELEFKTMLLNNYRTQNEFTGSGNIRGGMLTITTPIFFNNNNHACSFEFTEYEGFTLKGLGSCNLKGGFLFPVAFHLFDDEKAPLKE